MMNLHTTIDLDIKGFFKWWGDELAFLVPKNLRQALRDRSGTLVFTPNEQGFDLEFFRDEDNQATVNRRLDLADTGAYSQFKSRYPAIEKAECVLRLTSAQSLQKVIYLPLAALENLAQVIGFELDRYTPFTAEQVYFSTVTLGKTEHGQVQILLILTPRVLLDRQLADLEAWGVRPQRVECQPSSDAVPQPASYNLLPDRYRQNGNRLSQSLHWLLNTVLLLLTLAILIWPVWMEGESVDYLKSRIKALEKQTRTVEAQQLEIDALHAETQKLIDIKRSSPALLAVLNELTTLLNDETWLTHMQYADKHMQIQGQSPSASALIGVLENSEFFNNVSFVSPLTQDKISGRERFQISMDVTMPAVAADKNTGPSDGEPADEEQPADESVDEAPVEESMGE